MGNVVESAWTNNPTKRCVVKFSNTLSEGIVTNIQKDIKKLTEEEIKELDNISHYNGFKELFKSFKEAHQITDNYEKLNSKLSSNNEIKSTIKKNKI